MNAANRAVVAVVAAAAAIACLMALGAMTGLLRADPAVFGGAIAGAIASLAALHGGTWALWALLFAALFLVSAAVVGLELLPGRRPPFLVVSSQGGDVCVERRTVRDFIEHVALGVSGVRVVHASVRMRGGGLVVRLRALVDTRAVLTEIGDELRATITDKVLTQLNLPIEQLDVQARMNPRRVSRPVVK